MTLFGWILFAFCWSLPFAVWAIRRWRVRVYLRRLPPPPAKGTARSVYPEFTHGLSCEDFTDLTAKPPPPNERWP